MYTIPNKADAFNSRQSEIDSVDIQILTSGYQGQGIRSGCAVSQRGAGANMSVDVAAGIMTWVFKDVSVSSANVAVTSADATNARFDLVSVNTSGVIAVTAGTASTSPVFPAVPASSVILAAVYVPAGATSIINSYIVDKRVIISYRSLQPPPVSPTTYDDEFDDTSGNSGTNNGLNARWTWVNQSTASISYSNQSYAAISVPAASSDNLRIIQQPIPASSSFTIETLVSVGGRDSGVANVGLIVRDGVNADAYSWHLSVRGSGVINLECAKWTNNTTFNSDPFTARSVTLTNRLFLRIAYTTGSTLLEFFYSYDGIAWIREGTIATDAVGITQMGLFVDETNNTGTTIGYFDYFRRVA